MDYTSFRDQAIKISNCQKYPHIWKWNEVIINIYIQLKKKVFKLIKNLGKVRIFIIKYIKTFKNIFR